MFLDITASHEQRDTIVQLARRTADNVFIPFTIGGGIRSREDAQAVLDAGADKISVNSAAVARPELMDELADTFGAQCVVLAIDAKRVAGGRFRGVRERRPGGDGPRRRRMGARGRRARGGGDPAHEHGPRRHEGRLRPAADARGRGRRRHSGDRLRRRRESSRHLSDAIEQARADAVLVASIFHYGQYQVREAKEHLRAAGIPRQALSRRLR